MIKEILKSSTLSLLESFDFSEVFQRGQPVSLRSVNQTSTWYGPKSRATETALFGVCPGLRDWHGLKHGLGKFRDSIRDRAELQNVESQLPSDSVVFIRSAGKVVVVVSAAENLVVKIEDHIFAEHAQKCAVSGWELFQNAELESRYPRIDLWGKQGSSVYYTVSEFVPNELPLFRSRGGKAWPQVLEKSILPVLERFHRANDVRKINGATWAGLISEKLSDRILPKELLPFWNETLDQLQDLPQIIPYGVISGDLQPQNTHFQGGEAIVLDWSNYSQASLAIDFFCKPFYSAVRDHNSPDSKKFWHYLASPRIGQPPKSLMEYAKLWSKWLEDWLKVKGVEDDLPLQLRGMCLDWLATMKHPWNPDGGLWKTPFPICFFKS